MFSSPIFNGITLSAKPRLKVAHLPSMLQIQIYSPLSATVYEKCASAKFPYFIHMQPSRAKIPPPHKMDSAVFLEVFTAWVVLVL